MFSILYVDDEPGLLEIGKLFLEQDNRFHVDTIVSAPEALDLLQTRQYDAIISDYQMPVMDGIEFLKRVRASGSSVPFIIFTGRGREEIVIQAFNEGADFYLQKGGEPVSQFAELGHKVLMAIQQRRAEATIREHERREADIIDFLPDATFAIDTRGVVIAWNRAMERMTGVGAAEILGKGNYEYSLPFYHERRPLLINLVLEDDPSARMKYPFIKSEGRTLISEITIQHFHGGNGASFWFTASPLYDTDGRIIGAIESIREITEWKRTQEALNESERRFRDLADMLPQAIFEADATGTLIYANRIAFETFGYSEEILKNGVNIVAMIAPADRHRAGAMLGQLISGKTELQTSYEYLALRKDGRTFPVSIFSSPVYRDGKITGVRGIIVDITERKTIEDDLRETEGRFSAFMDHLPVAAFIKDDHFTNLYVNKRMAEMFGAGEWVGRSVTDLFPPDAAEKMLEDDRQTLREGYRSTIEILKLKNGEERVFETQKFRIDRGNKPPLIGGFASDITGRKQAEDKVRESEQKYRTVFETTGTATVLIEDDSTISLANSEFERLSGYTRSDIENHMMWTEFVVQEDLDRMLAQHRMRRAGSEGALSHYEFRFRTRTGEIRDIYLTIDLIPGTTKSVASLLDITERKRMEERLVAAGAEFTSLLDQIQDIYYRSDAEGRLVQASRSWATLLGYGDISECIGRSIADDFYLVPSDRKRFLEAVIRDGKVTDYEVMLRKKDGTPVLVSTSSHARYDTAGGFLGVEGTFRDITVRKQQEKVLRAQLDLGLKLQKINTLKETLEACLDAAIAISGMDSGGVYIVDGQTGSVDLILHRNLKEAFVDSVSHYPAGSFNARIVHEGRPIYLPFARLREDHTPSQMAEGLRASAIIPITSGRQSIACLNVSSHSLWDIPETAKVALETIATQIGAAVERIRADEALAESEQRYRNVVEDQTEFICRFRPDGTHVFVNNAYCRYFGMSREEMIGHRFLPDIPPEDQPAIKRSFASLTREHPVDINVHRIIMPDGRVRWQRWSDRAIFDPDGRIIEYQSVGRDITEMKETEEALIQKTKDLDSRNRLISTLLDTVPIGLFMIESPSGKPVMANRIASQLLGRGILPAATKETLAEVYEVYRAGTTEPYPKDEMPVVRGLYGESRHVDDMEVVRPDGSRIRLEVFGTPVTDSQGRIVASLVSFLDITERKRAEQVIREANRKINLLTSITRHDVINQIAILRGFTTIALKKKPDHEITDLLEKIENSVSVIARQIEFTRIYQELGIHAPGWFRIREIVRQQKPGGVSLSCTCDAEVYADPMLERVFFNLFDNAVRHGGRTTTVTIRCLPGQGNSLLIRVEDDGIGIPAELKERIFEKGFGKHTGYGLFLAREILAITGITIRETGIPGEGARFEISVPDGTFRSGKPARP